MKNKSAKGYLPAILLLAASALIILSCGRDKVQSSGTGRIVIAEQYGLAYAPLQIIRVSGILEKKLPGWEVKWDKLVNTAAIREAMLSGNLDIGFMAIPPFLIGYSNGMKWKIFSGLSSVPVGLVTWKDGIDSIADLTSEDRIALPQPGSIQHILLSMAAEKIIGNPRHFDNQLVTMAHPDGMNALLQKREITAHFTAPPFIMQELKMPGFRSILTGKEAAGISFTFAVGAVTDSFSSANPSAVRALVSAIEEASDFIRTNPEKASELLSAEYQAEKDDILEYITWEGMVYGTKISGTEEFASFMEKSGYLKPGTDFGGIFLK